MSSDEPGSLLSPPVAPTEPVPTVPLDMPETHLTFLLVSGRRRTMQFEPETTIGRVKELVWNAWPSEWQNERPPAPSYLRVLYLGKILQDEETLTSLKLPIAPAPPTVVHLSIRQIPIASESDPVKKKKKRRAADVNPGSGAGAESGDTAGAGGCCGCIIC